MSNRIFIKQLWLENFKAYKEKTILPLSSFTTIIGYNGSGKTSAILGLQLLSLLAKGKSLKSASLRRNTKKKDLSFDPQYLSNYMSEYFKLGCSIEVDYALHDLNITFQVGPQGLEIVEETIKNENGEYLYQAKKDVGQDFKANLQLPHNDKLTVGNQEAVFVQLTKPEISKTLDFFFQQKLFTIAHRFKNVLSNIQFFYANLLDWNLSSYTRFKTLKEDGSNLASVLFYLCEDQQVKENIVKFIRETPKDQSIDLTFEKIQPNKIRIHQRTIPYFSEGQLRLLAVAAALYSAPEGSIVVFDDVASSLDAVRSPKLIKDIYRIGNNRNLQILLTSHNLPLLDELPVKAIPDVVFSYRIPDSGASSLIKIDQLDTYPELISQGPLGNLMRSGVIRKYVEEKRTNEQKKADSLKWLDEFEKGKKDE